jgi:hypothetical protein
MYPFLLEQAKTIIPSKSTLLSVMQELHVPFVIQNIPNDKRKGKSLSKESK